MICWRPREDRREFSQGSCGVVEGHDNPSQSQGEHGTGNVLSEYQASPAGIHYASRTCPHGVDCNLRCDDCDEEFDLYWSDPDAWGDGGIS